MPSTDVGRALPNLIVIGAQKCGTSSLHHYLRLHPQIAMSSPKELNFFIAEQNWRRGVDWYTAHFDARAACRGESSPNYTAHPQFEGVPERMAAVVPDARLIYLVRDPIERIASHWVHNYALRRVHGDLRETLLDPNRSYVARSRYFTQLQRFLEHYDRDRIMVIDTAELRTDRLPTLRAIYEFLGVDGSFEHPDLAIERHTSSARRRPTPLGLRVQRIRATRIGRRVPRRAWPALESALPLSTPIPKPDGVAEALGPDVIAVLQAEADRLRAWTGRALDSWSV